MFTRQIAQKIFKSKIKARPVKDGHCMPFKHRISFVTNSAANLICNRFRITPEIVSQLLLATIWSRCAVNLSIRPFLGQVVDLDLLLCTGFDLEHAVLFLCHIFTQWPMTDRKIERSNGRGFGWQQLLANSIEIFISHEKKSDLSRPEIYKAPKPWWLLK